MENKIAIGIVLATLLVVIVAFSGCIEGEPLLGPEHPVVTPTQPPTIQSITGNYKVQDVSGDEIRITGNYNQIKILNADVSLIRVTGNYNTVYYPKDARPVIKETGNGNAIKTY